MGKKCPKIELVIAYACGELKGKLAKRIRTHVTRCNECLEAAVAAKAAVESNCWDDEEFHPEDDPCEGCDADCNHCNLYHGKTGADYGNHGLWK